VDWADAIGGALLIAAGIWFALYSLNYNLGTARRMGPAYFPFGIGCLIVLLGIICLLPALRRAGPLPVIEWRPFFFICLGVLAFSVFMGRFGLVPATVALTLVSAFAEERPHMLTAIVLAATLCLIGVGIFSWGLGIPMPVLRWTN
jgi:hypothetical protein